MFDRKRECCSRRRASLRGAPLALPALILASLALFPGRAQAQETGFNLDQYRAAETPDDGFAISRPNDFGHLRFGAHLHLDYAYDPLVFETEQGNSDSQIGAVVEHQLVANVGVALGVLRRLVVFLGMPFNLLMSGQEGFNVGDVLAADGSTIGDLYLGARVRIWGENDGIFGIGFQAAVTFPTASWADESERYAGERNFTGHVEVLAEVRPGPVQVTLNIGARFRQAADFGDIGGFTSGHELTYGLGAAWRVIDLLEIRAELFGASTFEDFGNRENTPFEAIGGVRLFPGRGFVLGAAGGAGIVRGAGSPAARAVFTFGWALPVAEIGDRDGDGLRDDVDECPDDPEDLDDFEDENGCPDLDNDQDGIPDLEDRCPNEPEDMDEFEDRDGCPDPDNDQDGIQDGDDQCPNDREDVDQFEDEEGCPDPDNDHDGVLDVDDRCPLEPEDRDEFEDEDGCPDPDNDQDTVLDPDDECPTAPGDPANNGCPIAVRVDRAMIRILQRIEFEFDSDRLRPSATPILTEVAAVLRANPQIHRVRVEGHTDNAGRDAYNLDLSDRRANSVMRWLTEHGVEAARLEAQGFGETRPIEDNRTREGRQANRRVEFHIVDPAPPAEGSDQTVTEQ